MAAYQTTAISWRRVSGDSSRLGKDARLPGFGSVFFPQTLQGEESHSEPSHTQTDRQTEKKGKTKRQKARKQKSKKQEHSLAILQGATHIAYKEW